MELPNVNANVTASGLIVLLIGGAVKIFLSMIDMLKTLKTKEIESQPELRRIGIAERDQFRELLKETFDRYDERLGVLETKYDQCEKERAKDRKECEDRYLALAKLIKPTRTKR